MVCRVGAFATDWVTATSLELTTSSAHAVAGSRQIRAVTTAGSIKKCLCIRLKRSRRVPRISRLMCHSCEGWCVIYGLERAADCAAHNCIVTNARAACLGREAFVVKMPFIFATPPAGSICRGSASAALSCEFSPFGTHAQGEGAGPRALILAACSWT
jgi:hypothetical protein